MSCKSLLCEDDLLENDGAMTLDPRGKVSAIPFTLFATQEWYLPL